MAKKTKADDVEILVDFGQESGGLVPVSKGGMGTLSAGA